MASDFETFCGGILWNSSLTWGNGEWPELPECFQLTLLVWVPCAFLWLTLPLNVGYMYTHRGVPIPQSTLSAAKMIASIVHSMLCFSEMINVPGKGDYTLPALYVTAAIKILTMGLTIALFYLERRLGFITSGIQFVFWFLLLLFNIVPFYTKIFYVEDDVVHASTTIRQLIVFYLQFTIVLIQFALQFKAETLPKEIYTSTTKAPCPEIFASIVSRVTYWWMNGLVIAGHKKPLEDADLWEANPRDKCSTIVPAWETAWSKEVKRVKRAQDSNSSGTRVTFKNESVQTSSQRPIKSASLFRVMVLLYGPTVLKLICVKLVSDLLQFCGAYIILLLINYEEDKTIRQWKGIVYVAAMFLCDMIQLIFLNLNFYIGYTLGLRIKATLVSGIYRKISLSMVFLYTTLGPSMFAGLSLLVALIPINLIIATHVKKLQMKQMKVKDSRIKLMSELLSGIKAWKMYAWEKMFRTKVNLWRKSEMALLKKLAYMNGFADVLWTTTSYFVSLVTFVTYVFVSESHHLDAPKAFFSLILINIIRSPMSFMSELVLQLIQGQVSMKRIGDFLRMDDFPTSEDVHGNNIEKIATPVSIKNGTFSWTKRDSPTLHHINIDVPRGKLIAVVGPVGSGKSSLLSAILNEMEKISGDITIIGRVAYVPQEAWIQNMTLKDNVIFMSKYKAEEYKKVIKSCALLPDTSVLPDGDLTEIGEKGINLSGGQKHRVSLARAVYSDADIYLFDDPLSAVDAHVAKHLYDNVIGNDGLLWDKTRVLVTHSVHSLPLVDTVVVMDSGRITKMGSYTELMRNDHNFATFIQTHLTAETHNENSEEMDIVAPTQQDISSISGPDSNSGFTKGRDSVVERGNLRQSVVQNDEFTRHQLVLDEKSETRRVSYRVYLAYAKAFGPVFTVIIFITFAGIIVCQTLGNVWLSKWTEDPVLKAAAVTNFGVFHSRNYYYIAIFGGMGAAQALFSFIFLVLSSLRIVEAATKLHDLMLENVLRSPISFFETTPEGRIINRFSQDIYTIDTNLPKSLRKFTHFMFSVLCAIVVIVTTTPFSLVVLIPVVIVFYFVQQFYISTSRQLRRLESTALSLIYSHFSETIAGASSIRAYNVVDNFKASSDQRVDRNTVHTFAGLASDRWLAYRLQLMSKILIVAAVIFSVIGRDNLDGGLVGLSLVYAMQITDPLQWLAQKMSAIEADIVSVERVKEYSEMPTEAEWDIAGQTPPPEWPESGTIEFINYSMRYRPDLNVVLKKISCRIHGGEKVGVVGRTGAGKSSFTLALLRINEAAEGSITIDGRSIAAMGLYDLRSRLTILPQDPVLFSGTLRMNVDPFELYTDDQIWRVLDTVSMKSFVTTLPDQLDHECGEGGSNLSVGQKQLLCLARALLKKTKIIILDEATAAVDIETDDVIQQTITSKFSDCTVITIAHRLNTIMDCDRVMVLDAGSIAEFDSPSELLKDKTTIFYGLAEDAELM